MIDIGKGKELGASRTINPDHSNRDRNLDNKGNSNINRGLRFRNKDNNTRRVLSGRNGTNRDRRPSNLNISLKENMNEEKKKNKKESKMIKVADLLAKDSTYPMLILFAR
jgi:hypothetical protein